MKKLINPNQFEKTPEDYQQEANAANLLFVVGVIVGTVILLASTTLVVYALKILLSW